jgi:DNA mismatch endonuclease (patch repair protein)
MEQRERAPKPSDSATALRMRTQRQRDTGCEIDLRRELHKRGVRYRIDCRPIPEVPRRADIVMRAAKLAVFVDGCFWHGCPLHWKPPKQHSEWWEAKVAANIGRDKDTTAVLAGAGWMVVRIWEHEDAATAAEQIVNILSG